MAEGLKEMAIKAVIYREMATTFAAMDPRFQRMAQSPGGMGMSYSSQQGAMWDIYTTLGRTFAVLADAYERAAAATEESP